MLGEFSFPNEGLRRTFLNNFGEFSELFSRVSPLRVLSGDFKDDDSEVAFRFEFLKDFAASFLELRNKNIEDVDLFCNQRHHSQILDFSLTILCIFACICPFPVSLSHAGF